MHNYHWEQCANSEIYFPSILCMKFWCHGAVGIFKQIDNESKDGKIFQICMSKMQED